MTVKERIAAVEAYIAAKGFYYGETLIKNLFLSLKAKPFVVLAGISGTGKTKLVRLFAEAIGAAFSLVCVRPDWSDSSDLFGHVDLNQRFVKGACIDFIKAAELNPNRPYILCLDEMNLARVEHYMSDVLSVMETRRFDGSRIVTDPLVPDAFFGNDAVSAGRYENIRLPENLYIIGTVNMDETTFPFSKKVLDRVNTIEFSTVDLMALPSLEEQEPLLQETENDFLKASYITLKDCDKEDREYIEALCLRLMRINKHLESVGAHVGYRVRDEIVFYMLYNQKEALLEEQVAFDCQMMQKLLPRLQGSSEALKEVLTKLLKLCQSEGYTASASKISFMLTRYEEDGFISYWL